MQTPNGPRYTRDGSFHRAQNGRWLPGRRARAFRDGPAHPFPPGEVTVGADGAVSVAGGVVAQVGSSRFLSEPSLHRRARTAMSRQGVTPTRTRRQRSTRALSSPPIRMWSRVVDLLMMQRQAEMMQRALTVFHTEFNKIATEDLPKSVRKRGKR